MTAALPLLTNLRRRVGRLVIAWAEADGSDTICDGAPPAGDGTWQPTPPRYWPDPLEPLAGNWRNSTVGTDAIPR